MSTREVYEKYKHLDELLSDKEFLPDGLIGKITLDLWQAIKVEQAIAHKQEELLRDAIELASEGIGWVLAYFREKWNMDADLERIIAEAKEIAPALAENW